MCAMIVDSLNSVVNIMDDDLAGALEEAIDVSTPTRRRVSLLQVSNQRLIEGLDHIMALVDEEQQNQDAILSPTTPPLPELRPEEKDDISSMLATREAEIMRQYEEKLQKAIQEAQADSARQIQLAAEKREQELVLVRRATAEKEALQKRIAQAEINRKIQNITKLLIQNISHEIRSPLNVMTTGLHIIEDHLQMGSSKSNVKLQDLRDVIQEIKQSCLDCNTVLDDIVLYESVKLGDVRLHKEKCYIYKLVKDVLKEFTLHCKLVKISLLYEDMSAGEAVDDGPTVEVDKQKISNCIHAFISNGVRFCKGGGTVIVRIKWVSWCSVAENVSEQGFIRVEVIDTGSGLTEVFPCRLLHFPLYFTRCSL